MTLANKDILTVENLTVDIQGARGVVRAVDRVSLSLEAGQTLALVGETGSGKSMFCRAVMGILPRRARLAQGRILFDGRDLGLLPVKELCRIRGREIGFVLQNPMSSLNPVLSVGSQIVEPMRHHLGLSAPAARERAVELLQAVGIPRPEERFRSYPHQLSGGMRQRVAIAIALSCEPRLLIADEPTTALDVTVQAEILNLLGRLQRERGMAMLLVTHDFSVVAGRARDAAVMYGGRVVEKGSTLELYGAPRMHYAKALLDAVPRLDDPPNQPLRAIAGLPPDLAAPAPGCPFAPRCNRGEERCRQKDPPGRVAENGHWHACWFPLQGAGASGEGEER